MDKPWTCQECGAEDAGIHGHMPDCSLKHQVNEPPPPVDLGIIRRAKEATATEDCRKITPRDMLVQMIADMDAGKLVLDQCIVRGRETETTSGRSRFIERNAGVTRSETLALLALATHSECVEYFEP